MSTDMPTKSRKPYSNRMPRPDCPICGTPVPRARSKYCGRACMAVGKQGVQRARHAARTHCKRGHAFDEENTARDTRGHRRCRTCNREWAQRKAAS